MESFGWIAKAGKERDKSEFLDKISQNLSLKNDTLGVAFLGFTLNSLAF